MKSERLESVKLEESRSCMEDIGISLSLEPCKVVYFAYVASLFCILKMDPRLCHVMTPLTSFCMVTEISFNSRVSTT